MEPGSLAVIHSNDVMPTNADGVMGFRQNTDLLYLSGIDQEETVLLLFPDAADPADREILFVRETSAHIAVWEGPRLDKDGARAASGISRVEWSSAFDAALQRLAPRAERLLLATNEHPRASSEVESRNDRFVRKCREQFPLHRLGRLAPLMHRLRAIKQPGEIDLLRKACDLTGSAFRRVLGFIRPGVGEWEIEAEWLHEFVRSGARGFSFPPIIGSGANACVLHYVENRDRCRDGDLVLMDVGTECRGWNSDMTRTVPVNGRFSKRQREVYDAVLRVMRGADALLRPGNTPAAYQKQVLALMEEELVRLRLFSAADARAQGPEKPLVRKYFMHGASHHLGLDVHDVSPPDEAFAEGMVLTIEPGIYLPDENIGVRIETDVLIGRDGNTDLLAGTPIEAGEIEELMAR